MLKLYDHTSPINWTFRGEMTTEQLASNPALAPMLTEECVLYDDGQGKVFDWRYLSVLIGQYANYDEEGNPDISEDDPQAALDEVIRRMNVPPVTLDDITDAMLESTISISDYEDRVSLVEEAILELSETEV